MTPTVLLVEDDENDVFFFKRAMRLAGWVGAVQVTQDGKQAVDYLKGEGQFSRRDEFPIPSLILLDLKLPYLDGLQVLKWIREHSTLKQLAVIILSSSKARIDVETACHLGANAYVVKPTTIDELVDLVKSISAFWLKHNQFCVTATVSAC